MYSQDPPIFNDQAESHGHQGIKAHRLRFSMGSSGESFTLCANHELEIDG